MLTFYAWYSGILYRVAANIGLYLILLTYKGKILLLQQENLLSTQNENAWHFIKKVKEKDTFGERTIIQEVLKETQILLENITLLSSEKHEDSVQYLFHARLSDKNVDSIERGEGRILQFFGLNELNKLTIQPSTKSFFQKNRALIETLSVS